MPAERFIVCRLLNSISTNGIPNKSEPGFRKIRQILEEKVPVYLFTIPTLSNYLLGTKKKMFNAQVRDFSLTIFSINVLLDRFLLPNHFYGTPIPVPWDFHSKGVLESCEINSGRLVNNKRRP